MKHFVKAAAKRLVKRQWGQSTVEYLVVLTVGVIVLVTGTDPPIQKLALAIRDYYTDYSYAISISNMPNCYINKGASGAGHSVSVTVDKCPNLANPSWPVDISFN
jgi:hypothetical protein